MALPLIVEIVLSLLLIATVGYCALLERRLSALRRGQDGLKDTIAELNTAIAGADTSLRLLKANAAGIAAKLEDGIGRGRSLADELSLLTSSGDRIASRIEQSGPGSRVGLPATLSNRLQALRPQVARNVR